ncbi:MAG: putative RNA-binding protein with TRAM domain [Pseudohongiellaceae bacterium]|jgi:predicted RNA-binding protein with TRAM domain
MSSVGKIFVVVNLVLSLLVVGSLGALLQASKATAEENVNLQNQIVEVQADFEQQLSARDAELRSVEHEKQRLVEENQDLDVRASNAENAADKQEANNRELDNNLSKLTSSYSLLQGDLSARDQASRDLQGRNDDLTAQSQSALDDARQAEQARRDAVDRANGLSKQITMLEDENAEALARAYEAEMLVEVAVEGGFNPSLIMGMPLIHAEVADVDSEYGFVILNKGANDGVELGYTFEVYNTENGYLGQVKVDQVHPNYATATIEAENSAGPGIQRFALASTKL